MGDALGIPGPVPGPGANGPLWVGATVVLAPIFEEIVYRERLLPALEERFGGVSALVLSSAAFALPHTDTWAMAGSFAAGLVLGGVMLTSRDVALCIGVHAGLNLRLASL
jgi:membrane protease YdiL (CAAX protease family)